MLNVAAIAPAPKPVQCHEPQRCAQNQPIDYPHEDLFRLLFPEGPVTSHDRKTGSLIDSD